MILNYLDLSTGHLSQNDFDILQEVANTKNGDFPFRVVDHEFGLLVFMPPPVDLQEVLEELPESGISPNLLNVLDYAQELKCSLLNFDQDGGTIEQLPIYDW